jgi:hypothetical protein
MSYSLLIPLLWMGEEKLAPLPLPHLVVYQVLPSSLRTEVQGTNLAPKCTANGGSVRIQYKSLVQTDVFPKMKLRDLVISKT